MANKEDRLKHRKELKKFDKDVETSTVQCENKNGFPVQSSSSDKAAVDQTIVVNTVVHQSISENSLESEDVKNEKAIVAQSSFPDAPGVNQYETINTDVAGQPMEVQSSPEAQISENTVVHQSISENSFVSGDARNQEGFAIWGRFEGTPYVEYEAMKTDVAGQPTKVQCSPQVQISGNTVVHQSGDAKDQKGVVAHTCSSLSDAPGAMQCETITTDVAGQPIEAQTSPEAQVSSNTVPHQSISENSGSYAMDQKGCVAQSSSSDTPAIQYDTTDTAVERQMTDIQSSPEAQISGTVVRQTKSKDSFECGDAKNQRVIVAQNSSPDTPGVIQYEIINIDVPGQPMEVQSSPDAQIHVSETTVIHQAMIDNSFKSGDVKNQEGIVAQNSSPDIQGVNQCETINTDVPGQPMEVQSSPEAPISENTVVHQSMREHTLKSGYPEDTVEHDVFLGDPLPLCTFMNIEINDITDNDIAVDEYITGTDEVLDSMLSPIALLQDKDKISAAENIGDNTNDPDHNDDDDPDYAPANIGDNTNDPDNNDDDSDYVPGSEPESSDDDQHEVPGSDEPSILLRMLGEEKRKNCISTPNASVPDEKSNNCTPEEDEKPNNCTPEEDEKTSICTMEDETLEMLEETEILRCKNSPSIYVRKVLKSDKTKQGVSKKCARVYNSYHACCVCLKKVQHIPEHMKCHADVEEVKTVLGMLPLPTDKLDVKASKQKLYKPYMDQLRRKGDHKHNLMVLKNKKGELLLGRRPTKPFEEEDYGPCPNCLEWILMESLPKHQKSCSIQKQSSPTPLQPTKKQLILQSVIMQDRITKSASSLMVKEVFPIMTRDKITTTAQNDALILGNGESQLRRSIDNVWKRKYYSSQHMRLCAKLLLHIRDIEKEETGEEHAEHTMWDYLAPPYFDSVVKAALMTAGPSWDDEEDLKSPSNAIKMKYEIGVMANAKISFSVKEGNRRGKEEAEEFLLLMKIEWTERVTRLARSILNRRHFNKGIHLPTPDDLQKMSAFLKDELKTQDLSNPMNFKEVALLTECRLLSYNKRRSGEMEQVRLQDYVNRKVVMDDVDSALIGDLSQLEKDLLETQELLEIRGKTGRGVPVLIPADCKKPLEYLSSEKVRTAASIRSSNHYLFANSANNFHRAYDSLKYVTGKCGLQKPERITSITMRKYTATMTQVLDLNRHELDAVCRHLGHTENVHLQHYRTMSGFIERVNIGKLMLLQEFNLMAKYRGSKLEDINLEGVILEVDRSVQSETDLTDKENSSPSINEEQLTKASSTSSSNLNDADVDETGPADSEDEDEPPAKPQKKKRKPPCNKGRRRWTVEEEEEVKRLLGQFIEQKKLPKMKDCTKAMKTSREQNGVIWKRNWEVLKKKVMRMF